MIRSWSGSRMVPGRVEYKSYGYDFQPAAVRVEQLEEAIQIIQKMWREVTATFEGQHYKVAEARCEPHPIQSPDISWDEKTE